MAWNVEVTLRKNNQTIKSPSFASREDAEKELEEIRANIYQGGSVNRPWLALAAGGEILVAHVTGHQSGSER
jgi:hypothetical protein